MNRFDKQKVINNILDNMKGIRRDRALKFVTGKLKYGDPELQLYINNELIRRKRIVINEFKTLEDFYKQRERLKVLEKSFHESGNIIQESEAITIEGEIKEIIDNIKNSIVDMGKFFTTILSDEKLINDNAACAIFNINAKTWVNKKREYIEQFNEKDKLVYKLLTVCGVEYRNRRGRAKDWYDCSQWEMPVYWSVSEFMFREIDKNKDLKNATRKTFKKVFGDIPTCRVVKDLEGNIISVIPNDKDKGE